MMGVPFIGQWFSMTFYPPTLLYYVLPFVLGVHLFMFLHLAFAGLGMRRLLLFLGNSERASWILGYAFGFSGLSLSSLIWPHVCAVVAWLPWVVFSVLRLYREPTVKTFLFASVVSAMQLLTGMPEWIPVTWLILFAVLFGEARPTLRRILAVFGVVVFATCLTAVQLFPFLDLFFHSSRVDGPSWGIHVHQEAFLTWRGFVSFFAPAFDCQLLAWGVCFAKSQSWICFYYPTLVVSVMALVACWRFRQRMMTWGLAILVVASVLMAAGGIPIGVMHFPIKWMLIPFVAVFLMAGPALSDFDGGSCFRSLAALAVLVGFLFPFSGDWNGLAHFALQVGFALALLMAFRKRLSLWLVGVLMFLEMFCVMPKLNPTACADIWKVPLATKPLSGSRFCQSPATWRRFQIFDDKALVVPASIQLLTTDLNLFVGALSFNGFWPMQLSRPTYLEYLLCGQTNQMRNADALRDFIGISRVPDPQNQFRWIERPTAMPLVTAGQAPVATPKKFTALPDYRAEVQLSNPVPGFRADPSAKVQAFRLDNEHVDMDVVASNATYVVISQSYYHWWQARVNGKAAPVLVANGFAQAVPVPKGASHVVLIYRDYLLISGAIISAISVVALITLWAIMKCGRSFNVR